MTDRVPVSGGPGPGFDADALAHLDGLFGVAMRLTRDRADAEDLVQDTFLKAVRSAHRFEAGTNLRAWLFTILYNTFRNARRDARRDPIEVDSEAVDQAADVAVAAGADPERQLLRAARGEALRRALDDLPDAYRQAVWLRDVEDLPYAEIARVLDVPVGTVMSRISRGRRLLFGRLTDETTGSDGPDGRGPGGDRGRQS
jgi:RNA polymerase sigma-70 factor (ECF subfamily)